MHIPEKIEHIVESHRDEKEVGLWLFSLIPLGVAFIFFFIFLLPMEVLNKDVILVTGAGAGFAGLQGYWIHRGWRREEGSTILLGVLGLAATAVFVWAYINFLGEVLRSVFKGWAG